MKKLFLLLTAGVCAVPAFAQYQSSSIMLGQQPADIVRHEMNVPAHSFHQPNTANKPTGGFKEGWFSYVDVMFKTNTTKGWYTNIYQDSTVRQYDASTSTYYNLGTFGMGMSFDPTSEVYESTFNNLSALPGWVIGPNKPYRVDSIFLSGWYERKAYNNYTDTLFVELVRTNDPNFTFKRQFAASAANANINPLDSIARFASTIYDPVNNKVSDSVPATEKVTWTLVLNSTFFADSNGHTHGRTLALPTPMSVAAGEKLVTYVHFKSGHTYPFNKLADSVNNWHVYTYEIDGQNSYPKQYGKGKDLTSLLWATKQSKYGTGSGPFRINGHNSLIPIVAYQDPKGVGIPDMGFYLECDDCERAGINHVSGIIGRVNAYPNPAGNELFVPVTMTKAAGVQVSLTNTVGQQVAVQDLGKAAAGQTVTANFTTGSLPAGIYMYTVHADGQRITGRVVIMH